MFLALTNANRDKDLQAIAKGLLRVLKAHLPSASQTAEANHFWANGLKDPESNKPNKELADRVYLVMRCTVDAIQLNKSGLNPHGRRAELQGELMVCKAIRAQAPVAPSGFRKVAKIEGASSDSGSGIRVYNPSRLLGRLKSYEGVS